jgi:hypothetical protein
MSAVGHAFGGAGFPVGRGCAKTLEPPMLQCIFGHVGPISRDFIDSNRALSNLHGMQFWF